MAEFKIILGCLSALVSMALVLVNFGQRQAAATLLQQQVPWENNLQLHMQTIKDDTVSCNLLEVQLQQALNEIKGKEDEIQKVVRDGSEKNTQFENCKEEKIKKAEELLPKEKEHNDQEAAFKTETESWTAEVTNLKQQMEKTSQVCEFVKEDSEPAKKLCPAKEPAAAAEAPAAEAPAAEATAAAAPAAQ